MKTSNDLKQERHSLVTAQNDLIKTVEARSENPNFTEEEQRTFDANDTKIKDLDAQIKRAEAVEDAKKRAAESAGAGAGLPGSEEREMDKAMKRYSVHKAIRSLLPNQKLDGLELEMHQEFSQRAKDSGVAITGIAMPTELRADGQTVTQDSGGYGANLVATDLQAPVEFLRPKPILREMGATYLSNLSGNVDFPVNDGGITATWEGEIATVDPTKNAYSKKSMTPRRLASTVPVSMQNLFQSNVDLERLTIDEINAVVANALDVDGINGASGILNASGTNAVVGGTNGAAPTWAHIVDLESGVYVANANSSRMAYLINAATKGKLKKTKHEAGDLGYLMATDNTINGYMVGVSNLVPGDLTKGTADPVSAGIFGDFSQLIIGQWGFYDLDIDKKAKEGIYDITVNAFFDTLVRQPKAFSVVKDWDLSA
jgi:HK97 family phage major capsid protein